MRYCAHPPWPARSSRGGDGTPEDPYLVDTATQLDALRTNLTAHFRQTADIDLGVAPWNEASGWLRIGASTAGQRFTGVYDGGGYAISNLFINRPSTTYQGLFGYLDGAVVKNVRLEDVSVRGAQYTGALAGYAAGSVIEAARVTGWVKGSNDTGGLAGFVNGGSLHRIAVDTDVEGGDQTGGLAGYVTGNATVYHCSTLGTVQGTSNVGGLIGYLWDGGPVVADCYSRAAVSGETVGGLVGYMRGSHIHRSYSAGPVSGASYVGGLLGRYSSGTVQDSYWDTEASGQTTSAMGVGRTTTELFQRANYAGYNFHTLWAIAEGTDYPVLRDLGGYAPRQTADLATMAGSGTAGDPYIVATAAELDAMRLDLTAHYRMTNDIDLSATVTWDAGRGWTPISASSARSMARATPSAI